MNIGKGIALGIMGAAGIALATGAGALVGIAGGMLFSRQDIKQIKEKIEKGEELTKEEKDRIKAYDEAIDRVDELGESMNENADSLIKLRESRNKEEIEVIKEDE